MSKDITIPPEAVEAAARAVAEQLGDDWDDNRHALCGDDFGLTPEGAKMACRSIATAALRAGIAAWPGMLTERRARCDAVVLPFNLDADIGVIALPTENTNAEG